MHSIYFQSHIPETSRHWSACNGPPDLLDLTRLSPESPWIGAFFFGLPMKHPSSSPDTSVHFLGLLSNARHTLRNHWPLSGQEVRRMRRRLLALAVLTTVAATLPACLFGKPDVSVSLRANPYWGTLMFDVQAEADQVTLRDVVINHGGCKLPVGTASQLNKTVDLKLGQTWRGYSPDCGVQHVKEIEVTTEQGSFVFHF